MDPNIANAVRHSGTQRKQYDGPPFAEVDKKPPPPRPAPAPPSRPRPPGALSARQIIVYCVAAAGMLVYLAVRDLNPEKLFPETPRTAPTASAPRVLTLQWTTMTSDVYGFAYQNMLVEYLELQRSQDHEALQQYSEEHARHMQTFFSGTEVFVHTATEHTCEVRSRGATNTYWVLKRDVRPNS